MKAVELGRPDIFVGSDPIATAKELQTHLAEVQPEAQPLQARYAIEALGDPRELYGSRHLFVHVLGAHVLQTGLSEDELLYHGTYFGNALMETDFGRFAYIRHPAVQGLCLWLFETRIIASPTNPDFVGERIRSGVFVPVHAVESAFAA